jgi:putative lipoprotein
MFGRWLLPVAISAAAIAAPLAATACRREPPAAPRVTYPIVARFKCDDFIAVATFNEDRVTLKLPTRELTLPLAISGSGARYADATNEFWNKGDDAMFTLEGRVYNCRVADK